MSKLEIIIGLFENSIGNLSTIDTSLEPEKTMGENHISNTNNKIIDIWRKPIN